MNFYPIYKNKKLLPWIKWWLIKGNKVMPKHLSEWINSAEAITLTGVYKGSPLLNLNLNGNTSQTEVPSPEAPVPVNVVKGNNTINIHDTDYQVNLKGKNLFNDTMRQGVTQYNTGTYGSNNARITSTDWIKNVQAGTYTISANTSTTKTLQVSMVTFDTNGTFYNVDDVSGQWKTMPFTFTIPVDMQLKCNIRYSNDSGITPSEVTNIQLEQGSEATTYEPYYDYELCKIGDYQDVIYKENNKWYVDKYINKVTFNGSETWKRTQVSASSSYAFWNQYTNLNIPVGKFGQKYCDYFEYQEKIWEQSTPNHLAENNTYTSDLSILFNVDSSIATTLTEWNTWLSNHNTSVYYALATSTTTEITETTLVNQLEAIYNAKLQSGNNTITQTPSDLPFYLNFQYYEKG